MPTRSRHRRFRRGALVLPTLLTTGNLALGSLALGVLFDRGAEAALTAAVLIIAAGILDALDGMVARLTGSESRFGQEFDSLADVLSFGAAPAWLAYEYGLKALGPVGLAACVWYVTCTAWRLARFNVSAGTGARGFSGLPCPAAAGTVASFVVLIETLARFPSGASFLATSSLPSLPTMSWMSVGMAVLGWLMISKTPYVALKGLRLARPKPLTVPLMLVVFGFVLWSLPQLLFGLCLVYILLGLGLRVLTQVRWAGALAPELAAWAESQVGPRTDASPSKPDR